jgi:hypothetical protein
MIAFAQRRRRPAAPWGELNKRFGKYELVRKLGQGGMGAVYEARDPVLDRAVALKLVSPKLLAEGDTLARFQREARAAARLQHPNIVTVYELGEVEGTVFIAMELLEGLDLSQVIQPVDRLGIEDKVRILVEVCRGLDFAHKRGVVHRDVKPANIRILHDGTVKLVDFGIAHVAGSTLTQAGIVMGTPAYMAPEAIAGGRIDHRADVWSVGVVLYEVMAGARPYSGEFTRVLQQIMEEPTPVLDPALRLPEGLKDVLARALARSPSQRYPELAALARDLQAVIGRGWTSDTPIPIETRRRAFEHLWQEAEAHFAEGDSERALEAARQAQALDPSRPEIIALVDRIQDDLAAPAGRKTRVAAAAPPPAPVVPPPTPPPAAPSMAAELRRRGASALREQGAFGEPPATQTALLCPTRPLLATSGHDGAIRVWDVAAQRRVQVLRTELHRRTGHDALALALAFSPDGQLLASGGQDSNLKLWSVDAATAGEAERQLHRQPSGVTSLAYAAAGAWLVTGHGNRVLRVSDAGNGRLVATLRGPEAQIHLMALSPDGKRLAVASQDRTVRLFDLESRAQLYVITAHRKPASSLSFHADGTHFATVGQDNAVQLWDVERGASLASLWGPQDESFAAVALHGDQVVVALADGRVRIWGPA